MLLTYVDESYCQSCYYVAALVVSEADVRPLTRALDDVVTDAALGFPNHLPHDFELHGHDIFQGKNHYAGLQGMPRARIGIYDKALRAIGEHNVHIILRGVRSERLKARYRDRAFHPHAVALIQLLERVDQFAERFGELALVIADEPGQADQQPEYRADLRLAQNHGTWGYRSRRLTQIVDTLHFAPSTESRLLQAVDLIAFLYHRVETTPPNSDARAVRANERLWGRVAARVVGASCWCP